MSVFQEHIASAARQRASQFGACLVLALILGALGSGVARAAGPTATSTYSSPGTYSFTVPDGVSSLTVTAIGGGGGSVPGACNARGGRGAALTATVPVTPGEQLYVGVGAPGANSACGAGAGASGGEGGGGSGGSSTSGTGGAGGGGASLVGIASPSPGFPELLLVVAGAGGGGGGGAAGGDAGAPGGQGPGCTGVCGGNGGGGGAGTATSGGAGGTGTETTGGNGSFGLGGTGGANNGNVTGGGGGGGGYFGGGGGGGGSGGGAGGGGSSFVAPSGTTVSGPTPTSAASEVVITYGVPTADESTTSMAFPGSQPQGVASPEQTLTVTNNGAGTLIVSGVQLGGSAPGDYLIDNRCQQPVAPGSSCQIGVRFSPQAAGASSATLTLLTNAATAPSPVTLSGTGGALPQGPPGPSGSPGKVELVSCKTTTKTIKRHKRKVHVKRQVCKTKVVTGTVKFTTTGSVAHATVSRGGAVYASGVELPARHGGSRLVLVSKGTLPRGSLTLTVRSRRGGHWILQRTQIVIR